MKAYIEHCDCTLCIEIRRRDETILLMQAAFQEIARLTTSVLPNYARRDRCRELARAALDGKLAEALR